MRGPTKAGLKTLLRFKVRALPAMVTLEPWPERGMAVASLPSPLSGKRSRTLPGPSGLDVSGVGRVAGGGGEDVGTREGWGGLG